MAKFLLFRANLVARRAVQNLAYSAPSMPAKNCTIKSRDQASLGSIAHDGVADLVSICRGLK
jgi:hypothetical protein